MDRHSKRYGYLAVVMFALSALLAAGGCKTMMTSLALIIKGTDAPAEFPGLKGKKTVVVCRPLAHLQYRDPGTPRELATQISQLLEQRVPKIKMVDPEKVSAWCDEHEWEDFTAVGKAMDAEMVVAVDLTNFNLLDGQGLLRGRADATLQVYDMSQGKKSKPVFQKRMPGNVYPPAMAIPVADRTEPDFRQEFIEYLADCVARHFYAHDPHQDVGLDSRAGLRR